MTTVMPAGSDAELEALRRRAYGPDADIHSDPVALARLRELEQGVVGPSDDHRDAPDPTDGRTVDAANDGAPAPPDAAIPVDTAGPAAPPSASRPPRWRRLTILIAVAGVAAVVLVASLAFTAGSRPDQTLTATPADSEIPFPDRLQWLTSALGISRDALRSYRGVGDIVVWAGTARDGVDCILVTGTDGPFGFGCSREGDATADVVLDSRLASIPETDVPERSTLRFIFRDGRVDVWITEP